MITKLPPAKRRDIQAVADTPPAAPAASVSEKLAASYGRKSDEDQEGLNEQFMNNRQRAEKHGYVLPDTVDCRFEDDDTIGTSKHRDGLNRLVALVTAGEAAFTRVYVKDSTRFGRWSDPRYRFYLAVLLEEHGVEVVFAEHEEHVSYGSEMTPDVLKRFILEVMESIVSSQERDRLIRRVTAGMRYWAVRGFFPGARAPYGLKRYLADETSGALIQEVPDGVSIRAKNCRYKAVWKDDGSVTVIRRIYALIQEGKGLAKVAAALNADGIAGPKGGAWAPETVRRIARNSIYCGDLVWGRTTRDGDALPPGETDLSGKEAMVVHGFLKDAPVSRDAWKDVQSILDGNREKWLRRHATSAKYLLGGLIVCTKCGGTWHGHTSTAEERTQRRYYRHGVVPKGGGWCPNVNRYILADQIETSAMDLLTEILHDDSMQGLVEQAIADRLKNASSTNHARTQKNIEEQIVRLENAMRRMKRESAFDESETERRISREEISALAVETQQARSQLQLITQERSKVESLARKKGNLGERARNLRRVVEASDITVQKEALAMVIHRIEVDAWKQTATVAVRAL